MAILPAVSSAMHGAVVPIAYASMTGGSTSVTFSNIPQKYQDLYIVYYGQGNGSITLSLNGASTGYTYTFLLGTGSSASSSRGTYSALPISGTSSYNPAGVFCSANTHILNYANTTTYKTTIGRSAADANGSGFTELIAGLWSNTSAITSLSVGINSSTFATGSTVTLYGIRTVGQ